MNLKIASVAFILLIVSAACRSKGNGHLPPKQMEMVLMDISIAEGYSILAKDSLHKAGTKNYDSLGVWYKEIFAHHNITQRQFTESLDWYKNHPAELDSLYTDMLPIATQWQAKRDKGLH